MEKKSRKDSLLIIYYNKFEIFYIIIYMSLMMCEIKRN
jgi:hypothetical protein